MASGCLQRWQRHLRRHLWPLLGRQVAEVPTAIAVHIEVKR
jgi:hypothetical protein